MRIAVSADSNTLRYSSTSHTSKVGAGETKNEQSVRASMDNDVDEVPVRCIDEDFRGRNISLIPFDPRKHSRKEICLTIFQIGEMTNLLCAVSRSHDETLKESLQSNKYQYGAGLMTLPNLVSGRFGTARVRDIAEQRGTDFLVEKNSPRSLSLKPVSFTHVLRSLRILVSWEASEAHSSPG